LIDDVEQRLGIAKAEQLVGEINAALYLTKRNPQFNKDNFTKLDVANGTHPKPNMDSMTGIKPTTHPKGGPPLIDPVGPPVSQAGLPRMRTKARKPIMKDPSADLLIQLEDEVLESINAAETSENAETEKEGTIVVACWHLGLS